MKRPTNPQELRNRRIGKIRSTAYERNVTFRAIARELGVLPQTVSMIITYKGKSVRVARHVCERLGLQYKTYFGDERLYQ